MKRASTAEEKVQRDKALRSKTKSKSPSSGGVDLRVGKSSQSKSIQLSDYPQLQLRPQERQEETSLRAKTLNA